MPPHRHLSFRCRPGRSLTATPGPLSSLTHRRWAQVHDVRFTATTRAAHNIIDRYRDKLSAKAAAEGHGSIEKLRDAYRDKIDGIRRKKEASSDRGREESTANIPSRTETIQSESESDWTTTAPPPPPPPPKTTTTTTTTIPSSSSSKIKSLSQILDMSKIRDLPVPEISAIWRLRYAGNPHSLSAVIPTPTYTAMEVLARRCPQFVLPVPRIITPPPPPSPSPSSSAAETETEAEAEGPAPPQQRESRGAEIHFLQWTFDPASSTSTVLFTHLAEYKLRGEFAAPHTTITHHLDLAADKGVVLMQGRVAEGRGVSAEDAKWLVVCLQRFYGGWGVLNYSKPSSSSSSSSNGGGGGGNDSAAEKKEEEEEVGVDLERVERARQRRFLLESFAAGDERFSLEKLLEEAEKMG